MSDPKALVRLGLCFMIGGLFVYTGVVKAFDPLHFASDIENYRLVSWPVGMRVALYLPWLEILCGIALVAGCMRSGAIAILTAAMTVFIGLAIVTRLRGINLDCGCFGSVGKGLGFAGHLAIDAAIVVGLIALCLLPSGRRAL